MAQDEDRNSSAQNNIPYLLLDPGEGYQDEVDLTEFVKFFWKWKWLVIFFVLLCSVSAYFYAKSKPKRYKVTTTLMVHSSGGGEGGLSSMLSSVGGSIPILSGLIDNGSGGHLKLMNLIQSKPLARKVIEHLNLFEVFFPNIDSLEKKPTWEDAIGFFIGSIIEVDYKTKTKMLYLYVYNEDPQLAVDMSNSILISLQQLINDFDSTEEGRNKLFFQKLLLEKRKAYLDHERDLKNFYSKNNIPNVRSDIDIALGENFSVPRPMENIESQEEKLSKPNHYEPVLAKDIPQDVYYSFLTKEQMILQKLILSLTTQYELSRIKENKEKLSFQIIDPPMLTLNVFLPNVRFYVLVSIFLSTILSLVLLTFLRVFLKKN